MEDLTESNISRMLLYDLLPETMISSAPNVYWWCSYVYMVFTSNKMHGIKEVFMEKFSLSYIQ